ncbi:hypothetical protein [Paraclostridium bifermentans]|uniref:hypothetical protein n=1 Tax=Paraclostridium bifermentans TaxID=1490 RepID=UPI00374E4137
MCNKTKVVAQYLEGLFEGIYSSEEKANMYLDQVDSNVDIKQVYLTEEELIPILEEIYDNGDSEDLEKALYAIHPYLSVFKNIDINRLYLDIIDVSDLAQEDLDEDSIEEA